MSRLSDMPEAELEDLIRDCRLGGGAPTGHSVVAPLVTGSYPCAGLANFLQGLLKAGQVQGRSGAAPGPQRRSLLRQLFFWNLLGGGRVCLRTLT